ncbi:MAG: hydrogenase/urease accessory protein HupE [Arenicella sp.]
MRHLVILFLLLLQIYPLSYADELKPAYVQITEQRSEANETLWRVIWKVSERSTLGQIGELILPESCLPAEPSTTRRHQGNLINTSILTCGDGLWGQSIRINGLEKTKTDALLRVLSDEGQLTLRLTPTKPAAVLKRPHGSTISNVGLTYMVLGVEHILQGYDHLLFVIAMVLLISGYKRIAWTITAFTVAHSITLIATTFGYLSMPPRAVEAVIALSIVFLAVELVKRKSSKMSFTEANPWFVALLFGLLHGFGFAGALAEIGLPQNDLPMALLTFNLGVELGQLAVVAATLCILALLQRTSTRLASQFQLTAAYLIGITSMYWLIQRVVI